MSLSRSLAVVFTLTVAFWSCAAVSASAQTAPLPDSPTLDGPIALIPCVNLSGQLADEWVGDGITAALSADLTQRSLLVVGHQVGATWLVSGAFQHLGSDLRIIARVIDVRAGDIVYTHKLDGSMHDLFGLQDRIGDALERRFSGSPESGMPPSTQDRAMVPNEAPLPEGVLGANGVTGTLTLTAPEGVETSRRQRPAAGAGFMRPPLAGGPHTVAVRTSRPPVIDGRLDDSVWSEATHITEFVQMTPLEGAPGTELTEVWIAYDRNNLYFGLYAHYSDPGIIRANRSDRDETGGDDTMSVMFDPFLDQQRAYQFSVNGYGIQADAIVNAGRTGSSRSSSSPRGVVARPLQGAEGRAGDRAPQAQAFEGTVPGTRCLTLAVNQLTTTGRPKCRFRSRVYATHRGPPGSRIVGVFRLSASSEARVRVWCGHQCHNLLPDSLRRWACSKGWPTCRRAATWRSSRR